MTDLQLEAEHLHDLRQLVVPLLPVDGVARGDVLIVGVPHTAISNSAVRGLHRSLAEVAGHDEFGVLFAGGAGDDLTLHRLRPTEQAIVGMVYVRTPGSCPECGSSLVAVTAGHRCATRSCGTCGHHWTRYHEGRS